MALAAARRGSGNAGQRVRLEWFDGLVSELARCRGLLIGCPFITAAFNAHHRRPVARSGTALRLQVIALPASLLFWPIIAGNSASRAGASSRFVVVVTGLRYAGSWRAESARAYPHGFYRGPDTRPDRRSGHRLVCVRRGPGCKATSPWPSSWVASPPMFGTASNGS